jgi:hypothetical protein
MSDWGPIGDDQSTGINQSPISMYPIGDDHHLAIFAQTISIKKRSCVLKYYKKKGR